VTLVCSSTAAVTTGIQTFEITATAANITSQ
jgi:hypothetical protein